MEDLALCVPDSHLNEAWAIAFINREIIDRILPKDSFVARLRQILRICWLNRKSAKSALADEQSGSKWLENLFWADYVPYSLWRLQKSRIIGCRVDLSPFFSWKTLGVPHSSKTRCSQEFGRFNRMHASFPKSNADYSEIRRSLVWGGKTRHCDGGKRRRKGTLFQTCREMA